MTSVKKTAGVKKINKFSRPHLKMGFAWIGVFGKSCNSFLPINDHLANGREHPAAAALPKGFSQ